MELVVLTPVLVVFVLLALALGRYELARGQVVAGARAGADAAALAASANMAQSDASAAAAPALGAVRSCRDAAVGVDFASFSPGSDVRVTVTCRVDLSDVLLPGFPGSTTVTATEVAVIDPYRSVTP